MKKMIFALLLLLFGFTTDLQAGKIMGAAISYKGLPDGSYSVEFTIQRECDLPGPPANIPLELRSQGCLPARVVAMSTPYPSLPQSPLQNMCPTNGMPAIVDYVYSATVYFTPAEIRCRNWYFTVNLPNEQWSATANVVGQPNVFLEAFLDLDAGYLNETARFPGFRIAVARDTDVRFFLLGIDPNADSVAVSMTAPKQAAGVPVTYKPGFSHINPIASQPAFRYDTVTRQVTFKPNTYIPNVASWQGYNRYLAGCQGNEYRTKNGVTRLVGYSQSFAITEVFEPAPPNNLPEIRDFRIDSNLVDISRPYYVPGGQTIQVQFEAFDADSADPVNAYCIFPVANATPVMVPVWSPHSKPITAFTWSPTPYDVSPTPYIFEFMLTDRTSFQKYQFEIFVTTPLGLAKKSPLPPLFAVFPNPFSSEVSFKIGPAAGEQTLLIYNALGKEIDRLEINGRNSGEKTIRWENAGRFAAGTYIAKLIGADQFVQTLKFTKLP